MLNTPLVAYYSKFLSKTFQIEIPKWQFEDQDTWDSKQAIWRLKDPPIVPPEAVHLDTLCHVMSCLGNVENLLKLHQQT